MVAGAIAKGGATNVAAPSVALDTFTPGNLTLIS
jgi:hypothetical protein